MILSNKFVKIENGQKQVIVRNHIYDRYLQYINKSQFLTTDAQFISNNVKKKVNLCCIKFDESIEDISSVSYSDFDIVIEMENYDVTGNKNQSNIVYTFNSLNSIDRATNQFININDYSGKKITGIGFANSNHNILAFVDTSTYAIDVVQDEHLVITRNDEFKTNMTCKGYDLPLHLAPSKRFVTVVPGDDRKEEILYARLYSVGYGTALGRMEDEFKIDNNEIIIEENNYDFTFALSTGQRLTVFPRSSLQPTSSKYPQARYSYQEIYPGLMMQPTSNKYPLASNVKYIIFKYQICQINSNNEVTRLNQFYTMNYFSEYIGLFTVKNKIERRT